MKRKSLIVVIVLCGLFVGGCVMGRRTIDLTIPVSAALHAEQKDRIALIEVADKREFQNKPKDPSIPSIRGDVNEMASEEKSRMIGRQRNSYGAALGDVGLPEGVTVQSKVVSLVKEGFARNGYQVTQEEGVRDEIAVVINEFWGWFSPGMWNLSFEARISCDISFQIGGKSGIMTVSGYGKNVGQVASNANWQLAYTRTFQNFLSNLDTAIKAKDL